MYPQLPLSSSQGVSVKTANSCPEGIVVLAKTVGLAAPPEALALMYESELPNVLWR
jgi:hypothetical protein